MFVIGVMWLVAGRNTLPHTHTHTHTHTGTAACRGFIGWKQRGAVSESDDDDDDDDDDDRIDRDSARNGHAKNKRAAKVCPRVPSSFARSCIRCSAGSACGVLGECWLCARRPHSAI
jgi:hypothetical protein